MTTADVRMSPKTPGIYFLEQLNVPDEVEGKPNSGGPGINCKRGEQGKKRCCETELFENAAIIGLHYVDWH